MLLACFSAAQICGNLFWKYVSMNYNKSACISVQELRAIYQAVGIV